MDNEHVVQFYRFMNWLSERNGQFMAQLHYYTCYQKEVDQRWQPDHLEDSKLNDDQDEGLRMV